MKALELKDRIVLEVFGKEECTPSYVAELLRQVADQIELDGRKGGSYDDEYIGEPDKAEPYNILWERENREFGGFRMGNRSLISDAYYGTKEFFPVSCVTREDIDSKGFDASNIDDDTMEGIASQMDIYACEGVGYWEALEGACKDYEIPRKED